jgi:hypothetical protein
MSHYPPPPKHRYGAVVDGVVYAIAVVSVADRDVRIPSIHPQTICLDPEVFSMRILILIFSLLMANICFALQSPEPTSFTLKVINHSRETLQFIGSDPARKSALFTPVGSPTQTLLPGGTLILTATPLFPKMGIVTDLNFRDTHGNGHLLHINNPCQIDAAQTAPTVSMNTKGMAGFVASQSLNTENNPAGLLFNSATVEIENKV